MPQEMQWTEARAHSSIASHMESCLQSLADAQFLYNIII